MKTMHAEKIPWKFNVLLLDPSLVILLGVPLLGSVDDRRKNKLFNSLISRQMQR